MVVKAVIGGNFGDEGKGLMTDYFCHQAIQNGSCLNVLTNGGAQRGHTVCTPYNRHVFHHLGSGSFNWTDTYIPKQYICNPMIFVNEWNEVRYPTIIYVNPKALISTPFDMISDQIIREHRGKHDTCGYGIYLTRQRNGHTYGDYLKYSDSEIKSDLVKIRSYYSRQVEYMSRKWSEIFFNDMLIENYIRDLRLMQKITGIADNDILTEYNTVVFENAQGLLLDKDIDPIYGTSSNTGLKAVFEILEDREADVEACYVSRTYLTRHGDGELPGELHIDIKDETNVYNEFQGRLRYAPLATDSLIRRIKKDSKDYKVDISIAYTHADEIEVPHTEYTRYKSYGRTRNCIKTV